MHITTEGQELAFGYLNSSREDEKLKHYAWSLEYGEVFRVAVQQSISRAIMTYPAGASISMQYDLFNSLHGCQQSPHPKMKLSLFTRLFV